MNTQKNAFLIFGVLSLIIIVFFCAKVGAAADATLDTDAFNMAARQPNGVGWCWAGSSQFVLNYYGIGVDKCEIANWTRDQENWGYDDCCITANQTGAVCNRGMWLYDFGTTHPGTVLENLYHWGVRSRARDVPISQSDIVYEINMGRPIMMDWLLYPDGGQITEDSGHVEVINGYRQDGSIIEVWNPWPATSGVYAGGYKDWTYSAVVSSSDHRWRYALSMNSDLPTLYVSLNTSFGGVLAGSISTAHVLTISNTTPPPPNPFDPAPAVALMIDDVRSEGTDGNMFTKTNDTCSNTTVPLGGSCTVGIVFSPTSAGHKWANIAFTSNAINGRSMDITLDGYGVAGLTVSKTGTGTGSVVASQGSINCGAGSAACYSQYWASTPVTLTATPSADSRFDGWITGAGNAFVCNGSTGNCQFTISDNTTVTANFANMPPVGSISINNGAAQTNSSSVTLNLSATDANGVYWMQFSNDNVNWSTPESYATTKAWTLSPGDGTKAVYVKFMDYASIWSTAYSDTITSSRPDLVVTSISASPAVISAGQSITLTGAVKNQGTAPAGYFRVRAYLSPDPVITTSDTALGAPDGIEVYSLAAGSGTTLGVYSTNINVAAGTYYVGAIVDSSNLIAESNEANNALAGSQVTVGYSLSVTKTGTGSGTVSGSGINCGADCTEAYASGATVTLTATPSSGSSFAGWSGACSGTGTCVVTMDADKTVTAPFNNLTISKAGDGSGTVTSSPAGISCGTDCTESYAPGTKVTLTATHPLGSSFAGWSGGGCSGAGKTCVVTMDAAATVSAFFTTAPPAAGYYGAWSGAWCDPWDPSSCWDSGTDYCNGDDWNPYTCPAGVEKTCHDVAYYTEFDADEWVYRSVTCTAKHNLTISKAGTGSGTVTSSPAGISCDADCAEPYAPGTTVTLTATPSSGSTFEGWSLSGCSGTGPCVVTMDTSIAVTATFSATTSIYGTWQSAWCDVNYSSSSCWNSGIDSCNGDDWNAYTCPSGVSKTCNDAAYYEYYEDEYYYEAASWNYRTVICVSGQ